MFEVIGERIDTSRKLVQAAVFRAVPPGTALMRLKQRDQPFNLEADLPLAAVINGFFFFHAVVVLAMIRNTDFRRNINARCQG